MITHNTHTVVASGSCFLSAEQEPRVGVPSIVSPPTTNPPRSNSLEVGNDRNTANDGRSHEHASRKSRGRSLTSEHVRTLDPLSGAVRVEKSSRRGETKRCRDVAA